MSFDTDQGEPSIEQEVTDGLYVYGMGTGSIDLDRPLDDYPDVHGIQVGELIVFARWVNLADYSEDAIRERAEDEMRLINEAQHHHDVVATIHQMIPVLPAIFGSVYASKADLTGSLQESHDPVVEQLKWLTNRDEWVVHVYLTGSVSDAALAANPELQELASELEQASTGRAYMMKQRYEQQLAEAEEAYEHEIVRELISNIRPHTAEISPEEGRRSVEEDSQRTEIARITTLMDRGQSELFFEVLETFQESRDVVDLEVTGPWPPYSFAVPAQKVTDDA